MVGAAEQPRGRPVNLNADQQSVYAAVDDTIYRGLDTIAGDAGLHRTRAAAVLVGLRRLGLVEPAVTEEIFGWRRTSGHKSEGDR